MEDFLTDHSELFHRLPWLESFLELSPIITEYFFIPHIKQHNWTLQKTQQELSQSIEDFKIYLNEQRLDGFIRDIGESERVLEVGFGQPTVKSPHVGGRRMSIGMSRSIESLSIVEKLETGNRGKNITVRRSEGTRSGFLSDYLLGLEDNSSDSATNPNMISIPDYCPEGYALPEVEEYTGRSEERGRSSFLSDYLLGFEDNSSDSMTNPNMISIPDYCPEGYALPDVEDIEGGKGSGKQAEKHTEVGGSVLKGLKKKKGRTRQKSYFGKKRLKSDPESKGREKRVSTFQVLQDNFISLEEDDPLEETPTSRIATKNNQALIVSVTNKDVDIDSFEIFSTLEDFEKIFLLPLPNTPPDWLLDFLEKGLMYESLDLSTIYLNNQYKPDSKYFRKTATGIEPGILRILFGLLTRNRFLKTLNLSHCNIGLGGVKMLSQLIVDMKEDFPISHIDLSHNQFTSNEVDILNSAIEHNNFSLVQIDLEETDEVLANDILNLAGGDITWDSCLRKNKILCKSNTGILKCVNNNHPELVLEKRPLITPIIGYCLSNTKNYLTTLNISSFNIKELPEALSRLSLLEKLIIKKTKIRVIPDSIGKLRRLKVLAIPLNPIVKIPDTISILHCLEILDISSTNIRKIPITAIKLPNLKKLYVDNMKGILNVPNVPEFKNWEKIEKKEEGGTHLLRLLKEYYNKEVPVSRCKLMFVGDENVGKTSLVRLLRYYLDNKKISKLVEKGKTVDVPIEKYNSATEGIEIQNVLINQKNKLSVEYSIWDFAGQDTYYATHQFFLTGASIYLVICKMTDFDEFANSRVDYWLQSINCQSEGAPILLIGTHYEGVKQDWKLFKSKMELTFKTRYLTLIDILPINNLTGEGLPDVLDMIQKISVSKKYQKILKIGENVPVNFLALEETAKAMRSSLNFPILKWSDWIEVAKGWSISNAQEISNATKFLHDLGEILYFDEAGLRDVVILDSGWLMEVFASVVSAKYDPKYGMSGDIKRGILHLEHLDLIWKPNPVKPHLNFTSRFHPFLLAILEKFEVLHRISGESLCNNDIFDMENLEVENTDDEVSNIKQMGKCVVPCLLPIDRPDEEIDTYWHPITTSIQIGRIYNFEFVPIGFFSRLMVRLLSSDWIPLVFWANGILLSQDSLLKIELVKEQYYLDVSVRGDISPHLLGELLQGIDTLICDWLKNVKYDVYVPCNMCKIDPHQFTLKDCEDAISSTNATIYCPKCTTEILTTNLAPDLCMIGVLSADKIFTVDQVRIGSQVGIGGFALVYLGYVNEQEVAVKQLILSEDNPDTLEYLAEFRREVWLMSRLYHKNIVRLIGIVRDPQSMIMEFCGSGNLYTWCGENNSYFDTEGMETRLSFCMDIAQGMEFMHSLNPPIIHRDLKTPNVMLKVIPDPPGLTCKITDFGLSKSMKWETVIEGKVVDNPIWLAPEVLLSQKYTEKVDLYAFGVMMWELISDRRYFSEISHFSKIDHLVRQGERDTIPDHPAVPEYYIELLKRSWDQNPDERPSFSQCTEILNNRSFNTNFRVEPSKVTYDTFSFRTFNKLQSQME